jgi:hypothetical protein
MGIRNMKMPSVRRCLDSSHPQEAIGVEEIEVSGLWFIPHQRGQKIPGVFRYTESQGCSLDLQGGFSGTKFHFSHNPSVLLGETASGQQITLLDCRGTRTLSGSSLPIRTEYDLDLAVIGKHYDRPQDVIMNSVSLRCSHLDEWANMPNFTWTFETGITTVAYREPDPIPLYRADGYTVSMYLGASTSHGTSTVGMSQTAHLVMGHIESRPLAKYRQLAVRLADLLAFLVGQPVDVTEMKVFEEGSSLTILPGQRPFQGKDVAWHEMNLPLHGQEQRVSTIVTNWMNRYDALEPIWELYRNVVFNPALPTSLKFVSLAQALEAYQRLAVPKPRSNNTGKVTLHDRLSSLVQREPGLRRLLDSEALIETIVTTRNYLVHRDEKLKNRALTGRSLAGATARLKMAADLILLRELGFTKEEVESLLTGDSQWGINLRLLRDLEGIDFSE